MELLIKPKSGTIRWMDKKTGAYKDTNLSADENLAKITDAEKSDLTVSYFNGSIANCIRLTAPTIHLQCVRIWGSFPINISMAA